MSFIIAISFILHFITLLIIVLQTIRIRDLSLNEQTKNLYKKEMEETLSAYLLEMKEENDKFLHHFQSVGTNKRVDEKKNDVDESITNLLQESEVDEDLPLPTYEDGDQLIQSNEAQALHMYHQGFSIEQIAKKLNRGKTEIDLLIKFRQEKS